FTLDSLAQRQFGLIKLVFLVVGPAEAVEIRAVVRLLLKRPLNQIARFIKTNAAIGQHVAVIVQHHAVLRIHVDNFLELFLGLVVLLLALENRAQNQPRQFVFRGLRRQRFRLARRFLGFLVALATLIDLRVAEIGFAVARVALQIGLQ